MTKVDIILPLYRPHDGWESAVSESACALRDHFKDKDLRLHFIIVNDGSDLSYFPEEKQNVVRNAAGGDFTFLTYSENHGKGYSLRYAVARAEGDYQVYTDGDFPFGWECVASAVETLLTGQNVVMGVRGKEYGRALTPFRRFVSASVLLLNRFLLGLPKRNADTQAGMKGFDASGKKCFLATTVDSFIFDMEFILLASRSGLKIGTIPLSLRPGLRFSRMGGGTVWRELRRFAGILWRVRILGKGIPVK